ncbi:hypothetical protein M2454_002497 [Aequitasia blattaphilus]|uniref:GrdX family protein n=1 Tax=Aequitasia blattaphilus TaxID=2949332 RepID=A0ABT1EC35_9FIRM|nr:GrdX family protein [Aequitasia blattaphilus]MCP1103411.1 GrdX family protein [Aequitasia blattaphilus]MCR8616051.1 GrdX family protein [Aequitasia blattaphilus]
MDDYIIITNNPMVVEEFGTEKEIEFYDVDYENILVKVRDKIYKGHELLSHPLSGSVKPGETPYKSIMVSKRVGSLEEKYVKLIESSIQTVGKFSFKPTINDQKTLKDLQVVDRTLLNSAIASADA